MSREVSPWLQPYEEAAENVLLDEQGQRLLQVNGGYIEKLLLQRKNDAEILEDIIKNHRQIMQIMPERLIQIAKFLPKHLADSLHFRFLQGVGMYYLLVKKKDKAHKGWQSCLNGFMQLQRCKLSGELAVEVPYYISLVAEQTGQPLGQLLVMTDPCPTHA